MISELHLERCILTRGTALLVLMLIALATACGVGWVEPSLPLFCLPFNYQPAECASYAHIRRIG